MPEPLSAPHLPPGNDWFPEDLKTAGLPAAFARHWTTDPGRRLFHDPDRGWIDRGEFDRSTRTAARRLAVAGVTAGDRVLTSAHSSIDLIISHVAALRLGAALVPVHTGYTDTELGHVLEDAAPVLAVLDEPHRTAQLAPHLPVVTPADLGAADASRGSSGGPRPVLDDAGPDDLALLPYTSGTTGRPKGVALSHRNLLAGALAVVAAWRWTPADRLVLCLPLFHMHGLGVGVHGTLVSGGSAVILPRFDPDDVLAAIDRHDATMFFGVPTMYQRLVDHPGVSRLEQLRLCVSGSAPLAAELHHQLGVEAGISVVERYGMTETMMNISNPFDGERRPGSVGLPLPGVEARLDEAAGGDGEGEIQLVGPNVFSGYWQQPDATAAAFTDDGWFRTGDVARIDDDGYWHIVGRTKELIISGGFNVFPREVEDALLDHSDVSEAAVAGVPDPEWGEIVTALVVARGPSLDTDDIARHCAARLVNYKRPRRIVVVDSLPRNALGKLVRPEVTELAATVSGPPSGPGRGQPLADDGDGETNLP